MLQFATTPVASSQKSVCNKFPSWAVRWQMTIDGQWNTVHTQNQPFWQVHSNGDDVNISYLTKMLNRQSTGIFHAHEVSQACWFDWKFGFKGKPGLKYNFFYCKQKTQNTPWPQTIQFGHCTWKTVDLLFMVCRCTQEKQESKSEK